MEIAHWPRVVHRPRSADDRLRRHASEGRRNRVHRSRADELQQHDAQRFSGDARSTQADHAEYHAAARGTGVELERQFEGFQVMGIKYTEIAGLGRAAVLRLPNPAGRQPCRRAGISTPAPAAFETRSRKQRRSDPINHPYRWSPSSDEPTSSTRTARSRTSLA